MPRKTSSGQGQPLVYIEPDSIKSLRALQAVLADHADGKKLSRQLNKRLTAEARKVQTAQRKNAGELDFASKGSSGTSRFNRSDRAAGYTKKGKKRSGKTLRDEMASTIRVKISKDNKNGSGAGVRIVQSSSDKTVNKIARRLNRKGFVRHPLFGNTDHWYNTTATNGIDWFWTPFAERRDEIRRGIANVLDDFTKELARDIDRKT